MFTIHILVEYLPKCYLCVEGIYFLLYTHIMTGLIMSYRNIAETNLGKDRIILALVIKLRERQGELDLSGACLGFFLLLLFLLPPFHTIVAEHGVQSHKLASSVSLETQWTKAPRYTSPQPH